MSKNSLDCLLRQRESLPLHLYLVLFPLHILLQTTSSYSTSLCALMEIQSKSAREMVKISLENSEFRAKWLEEHRKMQEFANEVRIIR